MHGEDTRPKKHHTIHVIITRRRHKVIVASGVVVCGVIAVCWPEQQAVTIVGGTLINLVWLLVEPVA